MFKYNSVLQFILEQNENLIESQKTITRKIVFSKSRDLYNVHIGFFFAPVGNSADTTASRASVSVIFQRYHLVRWNTIGVLWRSCCGRGNTARTMHLGDKTSPL